MKKALKTMLTMTLAVVMMFAFAACSSDYGKVEGALKDIGYEKVESTSQAEPFVDDSEVAVTPYVFKKLDGINTNYVIVLEFKATEDIKTFYQDSAAFRGIISDIEEDGTAEEIHKALEDAGIAKGNCLVFSINPIEAANVADAIKKA